MKKDDTIREPIDDLIEDLTVRIHLISIGKGKEYIKSAKCSELWKVIDKLKQLKKQY